MNDENEQQLTDEEKSQTDQDPPPTWLEWGVRLVSLALVVGLVGYVTVIGMRSNAPIDFEIDVMESQIEQRGDEWVVPATIKNTGATSVEDLAITMTLTVDEETVVSEELTIPLLGGSASTRGEFWIDRDPGQGTLGFDIGTYRVS